MKNIIKILAISILASCSGNNSSIVENNKEDSLRSNISINQKVNIRSYGQGIIDGKIQPTDNIETFACLDSINNPSQLTRKYFFEVYRTIGRNTDGALSEVIGGYLQTFLMTFTKEAIDKFLILEKKDQEIFINNLAYEFTMTDKNIKTKIDNYFLEISKTCTDCKNYEKPLKLIQKSILEASEKMK